MHRRIVQHEHTCTHLEQRRLRASFEALLLIALTALVLLAIPAALAQAGAEHSVKLQVRLSWARPPKEDTHREVGVTLRRLDEAGQPASFTVKDNALTVVTLNAGRYELITTRPVFIGGRWYGWDVEVPVTEAVNTIVLDQQNAVSVAAPEEPNVDVGPNEKTGSAANTLDPATTAALTNVVNRWTASLQSRDLDEHLSLYALQLHYLNGKRNVSRGEIMRDRQHFLKEYPEMSEIAIRDLQLEQVDGTPQAEFLKSWSFGGSSDLRGQERTWLTFEKREGRWVISSERDEPVQQSVPFASGTLEKQRP